MYVISKFSEQNKDVSQDTVNQFESSIFNDKSKNTVLIKNKNKYISLIIKWLILKIDIPYSKLLNSKYDESFCIHMGAEYGKSGYFFLQSSKKYAYFFDLWPYAFDSIKKYITRTKIDIVFTSSRQATEYLIEQGFKNIFWVPEAIDPTLYNFYPYEQKDIDVLELGRKYSKLHDKIVQPLHHHNKKHLYEINTGSIIFEDHDSLIQGLARTRISICYPRNITHPESAGNISTLTARYLQSMASKCLIVGESPLELKDLFGYDPVIALDINNAEKELINILDNFEDYIPLIEKNYFQVINYHKWSNRWELIKKTITLQTTPIKVTE